MDFNDVGIKVAGGAASILADGDVMRVFSEFGDRCLETYGIDIRTKPSFMSTQVLRQVRSFVSEYGVDDAVKIVNQAFAVPHCGNFKGAAIGTSLFSKGFRWYSNALLLEAGGDDGNGPGTSWEDFAISRKKA